MKPALSRHRASQLMLSHFPYLHQLLLWPDLDGLHLLGGLGLDAVRVEEHLQSETHGGPQSVPSAGHSWSWHNGTGWYVF